jgi:ribosomal protein S18 acetylase RimI-like enzyme
MGKASGKSMNEPRPYRNEPDLRAMQELLMAGRNATNGSYYIHIGDLKWWLYYPPLEGDFWGHIHLWDDPAQPGWLLGWVLISPDWVGIDLYTQPELRGSSLAQEMYLWAEEKAMNIARQNGRPSIHVLWVVQDEDVLGAHFRQRDYKLRRGMLHLTKSLDEFIPSSQLPKGFLVRGCKGEPEVAARAKTQYGAFESKAKYEQYVERFTNFMRSSVYDPELDIVAVRSDGQVGAFCIVWTDPVNRVGLFEPVGTHPDFQRQGLGRAVMREGLRRLQARGMKSAIVSTYEDDPVAIKYYEAVGFQVINRLGTYEKDV